MTSRFLSLTKCAHTIKKKIKKKRGKKEKKTKTTTTKNHRKKEKKYQRGVGGRWGTTLSQFMPKVYDQLKRLKSRGKLDQGESSPNFHYFQVV